MIDIGRLDKRVTVQRRSETLDDFGQPIIAWVDIKQVWASIKYIGGREKLRSGVVDSNLNLTIAVRYSVSLMPPKQADGWRIVYQAREGLREFAIVGSRDVDEKHKFIIFDAVEGSVVQS